MTCCTIQRWSCHCSKSWSSVATLPWPWTGCIAQSHLSSYVYFLYRYYYIFIKLVLYSIAIWSQQTFSLMRTGTSKFVTLVSVLWSVKNRLKTKVLLQELYELIICYYNFVLTSLTFVIQQPLWMSPEVLRGKPLSEKADVYSMSLKKLRKPFSLTKFCRLRYRNVGNFNSSRALRRARFL